MPLVLPSAVRAARLGSARSRTRAARLRCRHLLGHVPCRLRVLGGAVRPDAEWEAVAQEWAPRRLVLWSPRPVAAGVRVEIHLSRGALEPVSLAGQVAGLWRAASGTWVVLVCLGAAAELSDPQDHV